MPNPLYKKELFTAAVIVMVIAAVIGLWLISNYNCNYNLVLTNGKTGEKIAEFPVKEKDQFSITFIHSVNKSPLTDVYEIRNQEIFVVETIYYGFGAGVQTEIEDGQTLTFADDGAMVVSGIDKKIPDLSYFVGTVSDHILKLDNREISLRELCGQNCMVKFSCKKSLKL